MPRVLAGMKFERLSVFGDSMMAIAKSPITYITHTYHVAERLLHSLLQLPLQVLSVATRVMAMH